MAAQKRTGNPRNRAPGTSKLSTSEYKLPTTSSWKNANYAYPRGVGADAGKRPSYPINTMKRAKAALSYAARSSTAGTVTHIKHALRQKGGQFAALADRSQAGRRR